jgi:hypothetical protein
MGIVQSKRKEPKQKTNTSEKQIDKSNSSLGFDDCQSPSGRHPPILSFHSSSHAQKEVSLSSSFAAAQHSHPM